MLEFPNEDTPVACQPSGGPFDPCWSDDDGDGGDDSSFCGVYGSAVLVKLVVIHLQSTTSTTIEIHGKIYRSLTDKQLQG